MSSGAGAHLLRFALIRSSRGWFAPAVCGSVFPIPPGSTQTQPNLYRDRQTDWTRAGLGCLHVVQLQPCPACHNPHAHTSLMIHTLSDCTCTCRYLHAMVNQYPRTPFTSVTPVTHSLHTISEPWPAPLQRCRPVAAEAVGIPSVSRPHLIPGSELHWTSIGSCG